MDEQIFVEAQPRVVESDVESTARVRTYVLAVAAPFGVLAALALPALVSAFIH